MSSGWKSGDCSVEVCRPIRCLPSWGSWVPRVGRESAVLLTDDDDIEIAGRNLRHTSLVPTP
jgi:hypothetical protein